jgi:hypothetical protein
MNSADTAGVHVDDFSLILQHNFSVGYGTP